MTLFTTEIRETQSGVFLERLPVVSGQWERGNPTGTKTHVYRLGDHDGLTRDDRRDLFQTRTRMLTVCYDGRPICHRPMRNLHFDDPTQTLTVTHEDIRARGAKRKLWGTGSMTQQSVFDWRGYSLRGVVRQVLYYGFVHPYSAAWPLNVDVGGAETGSSPWAQFFAYDGQTVDSILSMVEDMGPDIELEPEFRNGVAWWAARVGTPYLTGPAFELPIRSVGKPGDGALTSLSQDRNGEEQATGVFTVGRGSEQDQRIGQFGLPASYQVSADFEIPYKEIDDQATLNALAQQWALAHAEPRIQVSAKVTTQDIDPSMLRIGSMLGIMVDPKHAWLDPGVKQHRVIGYAGTTESDDFDLVFEEG